MSEGCAVDSSFQRISENRVLRRIVGSRREREKEELSERR
jgi:hypothetical protein